MLLYLYNIKEKYMTEKINIKKIIKKNTTDSEIKKNIKDKIIKKANRESALHILKEIGKRDKHIVYENKKQKEKRGETKHKKNWKI